MLEYLIISEFKDNVPVCKHEMTGVLNTWERGSKALYYVAQLYVIRCPQVDISPVLETSSGKYIAYLLKYYIPHGLGKNLNWHLLSWRFALISCYNIFTDSQSLNGYRLCILF